MVVDAGLASGTAELEPVGVPGDSDWVSVPGVAVLGVWDSEPGELRDQEALRAEQ